MEKKEVEGRRRVNDKVIYEVDLYENMGNNIIRKGN